MRRGRAEFDAGGGKISPPMQTAQICWNSASCRADQRTVISNPVVGLALALAPRPARTARRVSCRRRKPRVRSQPRARHLAAPRPRWFLASVSRPFARDGRDRQHIHRCARHGLAHRLGPVFGQSTGPACSKPRNSAGLFRHTERGREYRSTFCGPALRSRHERHRAHGR